MEIDQAEFGEHPQVARRGLGALAHPLAVAALALWLVNDHLLKLSAPSPLTGKLSDVAGAIVLPLVIATLLEPFTRHPLRVGTVATAVVLGAINVLPAADAAYERTLSLLIPSTNTMDATDLLAVPFVLVAAWIWRHVAASDRPIRRAWGRALLGAGVVASMATSNDSPISQEFQGTHFLTEENPSVELTARFQIDGEDADIRWVTVDTSAVFLGELDPNEESPIVVTKRGTGEGTITLALADPESGPAEVTWTAYAFGEPAEVCVPFCLGGGEDAALPSLTIEAPPDTFGPQPIASVELTGGRTAYSIVEVVLPPGDSGITARVAGRVRSGRVLLRHDGVEFMLQGDSSTLVPRPAECEQGCVVELRLSILPPELSGAELVEFYSAPNEAGDEATGTSTNVDMSAARIRADAELPALDPDQPASRISIAVRIPEGPSFGDVLVVSSVIPGQVGRFYNFTLESVFVRTADSVPDLCFRTDAWVSAREQVEGGPTPPANPSVQIRVALLSAEPIDGELVMALGDEAADLC